MFACVTQWLGWSMEWRTKGGEKICGSDALHSLISRKFIQKLLDVCIDLQGKLPSTKKDLTTWDAKNLKWDPDVHPWFPVISEFPLAPPQ